MLTRTLALVVVFAGIGSASLTCDTNLNPLGSLAGAVLGANMTGCLTVAGGGLVSTDSTWSDFTMAWQVTQIQNGPNSLFEYKYTFSDPAHASDLLYVLLGLSNTCLFATKTDPPNGGTFCVYNLSDTLYQPGSYNSAGGGNTTNNPGLPGSIWALRLDGTPGSGTLDVTFDSVRRPVWQNVYARDADVSAVYNAGFLTGVNSYFIAAPDSNVVPEPNQVAAILCLLGAAWFTLRRRQIKT
ncbi:MAG: hypothetical protein C5B51_16840 [Terriglobia bacterium]|nr:MAG: hypothetical protein C5B51_16840 [Terriglobia bacterium]